MRRAFPCKEKQFDVWCEKVYRHADICCFDVGISEFLSDYRICSISIPLKCLLGRCKLVHVSHVVTEYVGSKALCRLQAGPKFP